MLDLWSFTFVPSQTRGVTSVLRLLPIGETNAGTRKERDQ
jgi:hypothetical protein